MYSSRILNLIIGALLALLIASCSQSSSDFVADSTPEPSFELDSKELAALAIDDDSSLTVEFGDPTLGATFFEAPPAGDAIASLLGTQLPSAVRTASSSKSKYNTTTPPAPPVSTCNKVTGICNMTERFWKVGDCCATTADIEYAAQVDFENETGVRSGVEVIFKRNGLEVGRATTDDTGFATFTEAGVARGPHSVGVCVAETASTGDCDCGCEEEEEECGPCDGKVNKLTLRYNGTTGGALTVTGGSKKGGSGTYFSGDVQPGGVFSFEAPAGEAFGTNIYLTIGGVESAIHTSCSVPIGPGIEFGPYTVLAGESLNGGPLCAGGDTEKSKGSKTGKTGKSSSKDPCYKYNKYYAKYQKALAKYGPEKAAKYLEKANKYKGQCGAATPPVDDCDTCNAPPPPCGCDEPTFDCNTCSYEANDGFYCASLDIAVYTDCIKGAVTGTGYFPTCNPMRVGMRNGMNFRSAYENGAVQGYLNYWDGSTRVTDEPIKWLIIAGVHSWFGGDNWMVHVYDGGKSFNLDSFEIWINDPATCTCYHCGGYLTGCYVNISYKFTQRCP